MIQDYRNQGIPFLGMNGNEGLKINSQKDQKKLKDQQRDNSQIKNFFHEPCVTDFFYRQKSNR